MVLKNDVSRETFTKKEGRNMSERRIKTTMTIIIPVDELEVLRHFSKISGIPLSRFFQDYSAGMVGMIKKLGYDRRSSLSKLDAAKFFIKTAKANI